MKFYILLLSLSLVHAEEVVKPISSELSTLIQKVKSSEGKDRRVLMNKLKLELRAMNREKRHETMQEIKKSFGKANCQGEHKPQHKNKEHKNHQPQFRPMHNGMGHGGHHR